MSINNETKLQGISTNVFFPTLLIFLYFENAFIVIAIYLFFIIWYFGTEVSVYSVLLNSTTNGKSYTVKTIALILLNGVFAMLVKTQDGGHFKVICIALLIYSAWFCYFEARHYYIKNKNTLDKCFT